MQYLNFDMSKLCSILSSVLFLNINKIDRKDAFSLNLAQFVNNKIGAIV